MELDLLLLREHALSVMVYGRECLLPTYSIMISITPLPQPQSNVDVYAYSTLREHP